jgi:hypothetical protein
MPSTASLLTHWYLHLPSLLLAALICLLLARLLLPALIYLLLAALIYLLPARPLLSFMLRAGNGVTRVLGAITYPVVATVGAITPRIVPPAAIIVVAIMWLVAARIVVFWVAMVIGVRL